MFENSLLFLALRFKIYFIRRGNRYGKTFEKRFEISQLHNRLNFHVNSMHDTLFGRAR